MKPGSNTMKTDEDLYARLNALGIDQTTIEHPPVFTVEESQSLCGHMEGGHVKNLFLRDKKKRIWLATVLEDREVDIKSLKKAIGAQGSLSFGSADLLWEVLGVKPGSVTPFSVINDPEHKVTVVLDSGLFDHNVVNAHPLRNDRTTQVKSDDLKRFFAEEGYDPLILDFGQPLDVQGLASEPA